MAQLTSFLMTADGDWDLTKGLRRVPDRATYVRQNLSVTFNFWVGEWFLDTREGVDHFALVYGQKFDRPLLEALYRDMAIATPGVGLVESVELRYDNQARALFVDFVGQTSDGDDISGPYIIGVQEGVET